MSYQPRTITAIPGIALVLLVLCLFGNNGLAETKNPSAAAGIRATITGLKLTAAVENTGPGGHASFDTFNSGADSSIQSSKSGRDECSNGRAEAHDGIAA
jgi:hypothetical protein